MSKPRNGRKDTSTGQDKRVKVTQDRAHGGPHGVRRPERAGGHIVRKGRLTFARAKRTGGGRS